MSTKTQAPDTGVSEFHYEADLAIDPPLPDSVVPTLTSDYFALKQGKNEDVVFDPVEGIKVISNRVTSVSQALARTEVAYGYEQLKKDIASLAKAAKDAGSKLNGSVICRCYNTHRVFRLKAIDNTVTVEAAALSWPDGTSSPWPAWS